MIVLALLINELFFRDSFQSLLTKLLSTFLSEDFSAQPDDLTVAQYAADCCT